MRSGTIVLVNRDVKLYEFLDTLVTRCGIPVMVVHMEVICCAQKAIRDIGLKNVKAVVVDAEMLERDANGLNFLGWLSKDCPEIPVWVSRCSPEKAKEIKKSMSRVGVIGASRLDYVQALGLPVECEVIAKHFVL
jgi:hypothetical protein